MSTGTLPIVMCDYEGGCEEYTEDHYTMCVDTINGMKVTAIPFGWSTAPGADHLCPEHSKPFEPEPTYRVCGGQGHRDIACGVSYEVAVKIRDDFDRDCARYGLSNPRTIILPENK